MAVPTADTTDFTYTGSAIPAPNYTVLANDAANTGGAALKAIADSGSALPGTVTVNFGSGLSEVLPVI